MPLPLLPFHSWPSRNSRRYTDGLHSNRHHDSPCRGGGGRGRGKRLLNRGMNSGNYIGKRDDTSGEGPSAAPQEDDHAHEALLGFALHTDGPDRLGWLMNLNQARAWPACSLRCLFLRGICMQGRPREACPACLA